MAEINLKIEPRVVKPWEEFLKVPAPAIALDGHVSGPPKSAADHFNFNHHEDVDRLQTPTTCKQVQLAIEEGILKTVYKFDKLNIYANDCDQDVCLSVWLLRNPGRIDNEMARQLVNLEDTLDRTGGFFPADTNSAEMQELAWVFKPYTDARFAGKLHGMPATDMHKIINDVCRRTTSYANGNGKEVEVDSAYKTIATYPRFIIVEEIGIYARTAMAANGMQAFVSARQNNNSTYTYTLCNLPEQEKIYCALNNAENKLGTDCWGGSNFIGGSPRKAGSKLKPEKLAEVINKVLKQQ